jgi:hypothetical protein
MLQSFSRRALVAGTTLAFAAGCSNYSSSPSRYSPVVASRRDVGEKMRVLPGPAVAGPIVVPAVPQNPNAPAGWPDRRGHHHKRRRSILFVADASSGVLMYDPKAVNGSPIGSITTGVNAPSQVAIDKAGALYVTNDGNNTVTVYPKGQSSPSLTIATGIDGPYGVGVDSKGKVFVSNINNNTVTAYAAGSTTPYATIDFGPYGQPVGVGIDASDNVFVASDTHNAVFEIPAGSSRVKSANLLGLNGPIGISFGNHDIIYVSNFSNSNVTVYRYGTTNPLETITAGIEMFGPTLNAFTASDMFFQSNENDNVVGYKKGATSPFSSLSGATTPLGIASEPLVKK